MELRQYLAVVWRWLWLLVLSIVLGGALAYSASSVMVPIYSASTTLLINQAPVSKSSDYNSLLTSERVAKTYTELMRKGPVLKAVIEKLHLGITPDALSAKTQVSVVRDTQLIAIDVRDPNPQQAADIANQIVEVFIRQNRDVQSERYTNSKQVLERQMTAAQVDIDRTLAGIGALANATTPAQLDEKTRLQGLLSQYRDTSATLLKSLGELRLAEAQTTDTVSIVDTASAPLEPVSPKLSVNTILGAILGLLIALGLIFLKENLSDAVRSIEDVTKLTGTLTLATIGRVSGASKLVIAADTHSPIAESYRMLRASLEFAAIDNETRTLVVTSSNPGEGKSTTAANLALAIAQTGKRVILVDTDLRRPTLHTLFQISNERGVTTALMDREHPARQYLVATTHHALFLLTSGPIPPNPAEMVGSQRMSQLIAELMQEADLVIFDSPPILAVVDAAIMARNCDATLLVVLANKTRSAALRRAREQLTQSGAKILGAVLNGVMSRCGDAYTYAYYGNDKKRQRSLHLGRLFVRTAKTSQLSPPKGES